MEEIKFKEKILQQAGDSLKSQKIKLIPIKLIEFRDRYYLIKCKNHVGEENRLFLRYDSNFWLIEKINSLPSIPERREYKYELRKKPIIIRKRPFIDISEKLDKLIESKRRRPEK